MSTSLYIVGILSLLIILYLITKAIKYRSTGPVSEEAIEKVCKHCQEQIPSRYSKSLCPNCKGFLM